MHPAHDGDLVGQQIESEPLFAEHGLLHHLGGGEERLRRHAPEVERIEVVALGLPVERIEVVALRHVAVHACALPRARCHSR